MDDFGKEMGFKLGDELSKLNGKEIKMDVVKEIIGNYYETVKEGDKVTVEIYRPKGKKGKYKIKTLSAVAKKSKTVRKNQIALKQKLSDKQKQTLRAWVGV
jgi:PDZ domain-containing secreted protein